MNYRISIISTCQLLLLTVCSVLAQPGYRVTYNLQGKRTGKAVLLCTTKQSVFMRATGEISPKTDQDSEPNAVIDEAMKRVEASKPVALNSRDVVLHQLKNPMLQFVETDTPYRYTVEDTIPTGWIIAKEFRQIGSYTCQKATTTYKGRRYVVWFTKTIPCSAGPWKLAGLPGLILEAVTTDGQYQFLFLACKSTEHNPKVMATQLNTPALSYPAYLMKYNTYYQEQANRIYRETSAGFLQRFGVVKMTPVSMNAENIDKNLEKRFMSDVK